MEEKGTSDVYHGGGGGGSGGGGLVWIQDPQGGVANNSTGVPPAVANTAFCVDGGAMAIVTSNPKNAAYTGVGGVGGSGSVQANNPCAVFGACGAGSIGDYVWKDANNNGVQDSGELPVAGVRVQLLSGTGTVLATDTTDASGLYLFPNLASGSYQVKILTASLPAGCVLSSKPNQGTDDAKDSDFDPTTGLSQTITIDAAGTGIAKDNLTVDGALYSPVFDLALKKTLAAGQSASVLPGSTVKFTITVYNQGAVDATAIQVTDYIPAGLTLADAAWTNAGGKATLNTPIAALAAGASTTRDISFTVNAGFTGSATNLAEISSARDGAGNTPTDVDSTPDNDPTNDGTPKNDVTNENGKTGGDEDDSDPEIITVIQCPTTTYQLCGTKTSYTISAPATHTNIKWYRDGVVIAGATTSDYAATQPGSYSFAGQDPATSCRDSLCCPIIITGCFDLALKKNLSIAQAASVTPGSLVKFTITVYNQGFIDATAIQVSDYIPTGLTLSDANWSVNNGIATLNTPIASLTAGSSTTRDITFTVNAGFTGTATNVAEISSSTGGTDVDSTPDNIPGNDGTPKNDVTNENGKTGGDEDDSDPEIINVAAGSIGDYVWKDANNNGVQDAGELPVAGVRVQLLSGTGTVLATDTTDASGLYLFPNLASGTYQVRILTVSLPAGCVLSTMQNQGGDDAKDSDFDPTAGLSQTVVIDALGTGIAKDNLTVDGALYSPKFDLALKKSLAVGQSASVTPGSTVKFTITVYNQGELDATAIQVTDYIPTGLTLSDANWSVNSGIATLNMPIASLAAGSSTTRDISFTVNAGFTGTATNVSEISSARDANGNTPTDIDSTPDNNSGNDGTPKNDVTNENGKNGGDEDDSDPEVITVTPTPVFDLALKKTLATGQSASVTPGSTVKFTITVYNQGNVDATNIQVLDYIPTGLTLNDANWSVSNGIATLNTPIAAVAAGATTTRDISFTVNAGFTGTATNVAEISSAKDGAGNTPTDVDSTPDNNPNNDGTPKNDVTNENGKNGGDEDDSDPETINVSIDCTKPVLTAGNVVCSGTTYSVVFYSSTSNVTASAGTISGNTVTGIPLGTNVVLTATEGTTCVNTVTVTAPTTCPTTCTLPNLTLGQPLCNGTTYTVSFTTDKGTVTSSAGTISGNSIINIPIGTDVAVTATDGACISRVSTKSPADCSTPCVNPSISLSGPICSTSGTTYSVNFTASAGATVTANAGVVGAGSITGIPAGSAVTITVKAAGCPDKIVVLPSPTTCVTCIKPTLTVGNVECNNGVYSVLFYSSVANVTAGVGTVSGNRVTGIPVGTNVTLTATQSAGCTSSLTVTGPSVCPTTCVLPSLTVGQPICDPRGTGYYRVSFTAGSGAIVTSSAGLIIDNLILDIPLGTNIVVTATDGSCVSKVNVTSPTNCSVACENPDISISGPICDENGTYHINFISNVGTVTTGIGTLTIRSAYEFVSGTVVGIPVGTNATLTVKVAGCPDKVITVPSPTTCATCTKPVLTAGNVSCSGTTYSVVFYSSTSNVAASAGTISGNTVSGIPLGTNVTLTASQSAGCSTELTIKGPSSCSTDPTCVMPSLIVGQPTCNGTGMYSVSFYNDRGSVSVNAGVISGYSVINIPVGTSLLITATEGSCVSQSTVLSPVNCNNVCENPALSVSGPICDPGAPNTYRLNYILSAGATLTVSAGTVGASQITGIPVGTPVTLTVKVAGCPDRVIVFPPVYCTPAKVDMHLKKMISKKQAKVGDVIDYTIKVWNESSTPATGVVVSDSLNAGVEYVSSSATRGSYSASTKQWSIGNMGPNGDTVTLTIRVKVLSQGVWFNTAEITKTNEGDVDSTPGNHQEGEDDIDHACFSVPIGVCVNEKVQASVPSQYTGVQWFKNGSSTPIATGNVVLLSELGTYTYTAVNNACPAQGCCPVIIEAGTNCCPVEICVPFTVTKRKKK